MTADPIKAIADAVLYEGYILYPYRPSSIKNRQRWTFGGVFPRNFSIQSGSDPWTLRTECLAEGTGRSAFSVRLRFLHLVTRGIEAFDPSAGGEADDAAWRPVAALEVGSQTFVAWEEAVEREVGTSDLRAADLVREPRRIAFAFPATHEREMLRDTAGATAGAVVRSGQALEGAMTIGAVALADDRWRLSLRIENLTPLSQDACESRTAAQGGAFVSTHALLSVTGGAFFSLTDPPQAAARDAEACVNEGLWPVLVGLAGSRDAILASPIILYDYPQIAPESPGDLFDGTEIDEILTLRILTMTDAEKAEAAAADPRVRDLLARTEALGAEDMARMHGALRSPRDFPKPTLAGASGGFSLAVGDRVRINPRAGGDIMDIVLAGKIAIVEAIERDFENRMHVAVTVEDDPGRDLGLGRFPGHRFFYSREELEAVGPSPSRGDAMSGILVAGIGNIFNGDDAFGVEVVRRLRVRPARGGVKVVDFGIRGIDLTYALMDDYDAVILVDAAARGHAPGTVTVVEPTTPDPRDLDPGDIMISGHDLDPAKVMKVVAALGGRCERLVLVACEPLELGGEDGVMGLSPPVAAAIEPAIRTVEALIEDFLNPSKEQAA